MRNISAFVGAAVIFMTAGGPGGFDAATAETTVPINQGWRKPQIEKWYTLSQGSRLIPRDWLFALEQAGSSEFFLDADNIKKYRYLPTADKPNLALPVGFAIDEQSDSGFSRTNLRWKKRQNGNETEWVGMNCSACHTTELTYQGKRMRVEGGPTLADFQSFMVDLNRALNETKNDNEKAKRFAARVLSENELRDADNSAMLKEALGKLIAWQESLERANKPKHDYGFGRLDAFGHIFNKVVIAAKRDGEEPTSHPSNAPVSYPFLWNVPQHDRVQWNGIAKKIKLGNYDVGALARNVGEVTGVFADTTWFVPTQPSDSPVVSSPSITSSAELDNLNELEKLLDSLRPPMWPTATLGKIDGPLRDRGRELFIAKDRTFSDGSPAPACSDCHKGLPRNNLKLPINACMVALDNIGTDVWMAKNALNHTASTGVLFGSVTMPLGPRYGETAPVVTMLTTTVGDIIIGDLGSVAKGVWGATDTRSTPRPRTARRNAANARSNAALQNLCMTGDEPLLAYKARPLTGIWATAPYLHNGSVPTLYDLLLPPSERPKWFPVGTREFDVKRVGFVTRVSDADDAAIAEPSGDNSFKFDTTLVGNSNAGHDYGNATLKPEERRALVEYMKGL